MKNLKKHLENNHMNSLYLVLRNASIGLLLLYVPKSIPYIGWTLIVFAGIGTGILLLLGALESDNNN